MLANSSLNREVMQQLVDGSYGDPFSVLGAHFATADPSSAERSVVIRCWLPGATQVRLVRPTGELLGVCEAVHTQGLFEAHVDTQTFNPEPLDYRIEATFSNAETIKLADPYAFPSTLSAAQINGLAVGSEARAYRILGAHPMRLESSKGHYVDGTRFAVWAPNAQRVSVVGAFNGWDGRRHVMRLHRRIGVWELFIPHVQIGDLYKFELLDRTGKLLPLKSDPYARAAELRPGTASKVASLPIPTGGLSKRIRANQRNAPISIYEVHVGSWRSNEAGGFLNWRALAEQLPGYASELGFTHIELMPISEFPFDGSWGYQTLGLFAPSARFGSAEDFAYFVQRCHALELGVIVDWVPAHFPTDAHGLAQFDGTALYEYADAREGFHHDWNTAIYNFSRNEVRQFLIASALYWVESFSVDGLRVDAVASMLYRDYSRKPGEWLPNHLGGRENLEASGLFKALNECLGSEAPGSITLAEESTAFPGVSRPTYSGGLGFHYKWNMGWMNDTLRYMAEDPIHRRWHHDKLTFGLVYAFSENYVLPISHDEVVHGKGSLWQRMPGDDWQKFANVRAYLSFMWAHPGKKLLFMGQEFAQREEWNYQQALPWHVLQHAEHAGVQLLVRDLNRLYTSEPALHRLDCEERGFQWLALNDSEHSVLAFARFDELGECVIAVINFTPVPRLNYRVALPNGIREISEVLNSDSTHYGGSNIGNGATALLAEHHPHGDFEHSTLMTLPPLAAVYFKARS